MAYEITLGDARNDIGIRNVSGLCASSEQFAAQVNSVTRRLLRRGSWFNTEQLMRVCYEGCRVVWPRQVGTVLGLRVPCGGSMEIKNKWWAVTGYPHGGWCGNAVMRDDDTAPCYREIISNTGKYLRWNIVKRNDVGKAMRVYGFQYGNQPLQEKNAAAQWIPGISIVAAAPYAQTTTLVTKVTQINFPETLEGMSYLYEFDPTTGAQIDLGEYQPGETSPSYRVSRVNGSGPGYVDGYGRCVRQAEALVKLAYVPALVDEDWLMLGNLDALKLGIQALRLEEQNDDVQAQIKISLAIKELNMELRERNPSQQTVIRTNDMSQEYCTVNPI